CPLKISELDGTPQVKHLDPHESTIRQGSNLQWMERSSLGGQHFCASHAGKTPSTVIDLGSYRRMACTRLPKRGRARPIDP
ncbi:hypothetical protein C6A85_09985, partial [Mycobacterium sp. ITM-2017-0098]